MSIVVGLCGLLGFVCEIIYRESTPASSFGPVMSLVPSPSTSRGGITVQPSYFTSSLYVNPLRDDILHLIQVYMEHYVQTQPVQPFALFKTIWNRIGWTWMHFKIFDSRSRDTFLKVTLRLFLGESRLSFSGVRQVDKMERAYGRH
jgi:hypothetical protein